jgi:hypothetical protein
MRLRLPRFLALSFARYRLDLVRVVFRGPFDSIRNIGHLRWVVPAASSRGSGWFGGGAET